jgi:uncharacterized protein (UPF0264 family)
MTQLLVSVRDVREAQAALEGGADVIDIKEPSRGALGAASPAVWRRVRALTDTPVSAALGELISLDVHNIAADVQGLDYVKVGLAGCAQHARWCEEWRALRDILPRPTQLVAVVYADAHAAGAPTCEMVLEMAAVLGLRMLLIDTFDKSQGDLFAARSERILRVYMAMARGFGMRVALAGSLKKSTFQRALALQPDWIAVRGAACAGEAREGRVVRSQVALLHNELRRGTNEERLSR